MVMVCFTLVYHYRLLEVSGYKITNVVANRTALDTIMLSGTKSLRIEEIPMDEMNLSESEMVIPVAHFHQVSQMLCRHDGAVIIMAEYIPPWTIIQPSSYDSAAVAHQSMA